MFQIEQPDTTSAKAELSKIERSAIEVVDQATHDYSIGQIKAADTFIKGINELFRKTEDLIKAAAASFKAEKEAITGPATRFIAEQRKRCLDWQLAEEARIKALKAAEAAAKNDPFEDRAALAVPDKASTVAGTRFKPWAITVTNPDRLWEAAMKDARYREYWIPDEKALTAKARAMGEMFNVPGVEAYREKTLHLGR